jgi:hypothetical protein
VEHGPGDRDGDLDHGFVGFHLHDDLVHRHDIADRHSPFDDLGFGQSLANIGHPEYEGHVSPPASP